MNRLLSSARQLRMLINSVNKELTMNELVVLSDLNDEFNREIREIEVNTREVNDRIHQMVLDKGLEPRVQFDRRTGIERRSS
jgi:hypothetical protein